MPVQFGRLEMQFAVRGAVKDKSGVLCECMELRSPSPSWPGSMMVLDEQGSDDSSAQGRGLSSATTVYLQAPPQTVLPKPEHRPNCRCPVNNYRVVVGNLSLGGNGWDGHPWNTECFSLSLSASVH